MRCLLLCVALSAGASAPLPPCAAAPAQESGKGGGDRVSPEAGRQIQEMLDEKESRTPAQRKLDSQLIYALKQKRGVKRGVPTQRIDLGQDAQGRVTVDITTAKVTGRLLLKIKKLGGEVVSTSEKYHTVRALLALEKLEALATIADVRFIAPAAKPMTNGGAATN